jgi:hypothetical protein
MINIGRMRLVVFTLEALIRNCLSNNHLRDQAENLDSTPRVHLNSNAARLSRLMVATCKYGGKYDMETNSKEG